MVSDLYIATRSDRPGICKVGRSCNARKRCATLSASQCFTVDPVHVYPGGGGYEKDVHVALQEHRLDGGSGREWFKLSAADAKKIIEKVVPGRWNGHSPRSVVRKGELVANPHHRLYDYELSMWQLGIPIDEDGIPVECVCGHRVGEDCTCGVNGARSGYHSD